MTMSPPTPAPVAAEGVSAGSDRRLLLRPGAPETIRSRRPEAVVVPAFVDEVVVEWQILARSG